MVMPRGVVVMMMTVVTVAVLPVRWSDRVMHRDLRRMDDGSMDRSGYLVEGRLGAPTPPNADVAPKAAIVSARASPVCTRAEFRTVVRGMLSARRRRSQQNSPVRPDVGSTAHRGGAGIR